MRKSRGVNGIYAGVQEDEMSRESVTVLLINVLFSAVVDLCVSPLEYNGAHIEMMKEEKSSGVA